MDAPEPVLTSTLADVRTLPLGQPAAPAVLERLRPSRSVPVAAFGSSL